VLIAARARRHAPGADPVREVRPRARPRLQTAGRPVLRLVDPTGYVSLQHKVLLRPLRERSAVRTRRAPR